MKKRRETWAGVCKDGLMLVHLTPVEDEFEHEVGRGPAGCRCEPEVHFLRNDRGICAIRIATHQKLK